MDNTDQAVLCVSCEGPTEQSNELAQSLWNQYTATADESLLDRAIVSEREAIIDTLSSEAHSDRAASCIHLALILETRYDHTKAESLLNEIIDLEREAVTLRPSGHPDRPLSCANLASSLWKHYNRFGDESSLNEAIKLEREVINLMPAGHLHRASACENLAISLRTYYKQTGNGLVLEEEADLLHEIINTCSPECYDRASVLTRLAMSLWLRYHCDWHQSLLMEAIERHREAVGLRPAGHPDQAFSYAMLASALWTCYHLNGDKLLLNEAIDLHREALIMRPKGHPDRALSCSNLALALWTCHEHTGDILVLNEVIDLYREAICLIPEGHSDRTASYVNLAMALKTRYDHTGDDILFDEAIHLHRKALSLRPAGHPDRASSCIGLASCLWTRFVHIRDPGLLDEIIDIQREAIKLRPKNHPNRDSACEHLALSLFARYTYTGNELLLNESIKLDREAISLRPHGHADRAISCGNLATSLWINYKRSGVKSMLDEAIDLHLEATTLLSVHDKWYSTVQLSWMLLQPETPHYNVSSAIRLLDHSLQHEPDDPASAISQIITVLDVLWAQCLEGRHSDNAALVPIYERMIQLLPLLSNPVLDMKSQLQRFRDVRRVGADAFVNAILAGQWRRGLESLEITQGILWTQRLHQRDPQLQDIPDAQAVELESCLRAILSYHHGTSLRTLEHSFGPSRDGLHSYSARMYAVIREIRAVPGMERFMLGETYESLCAVARDHPVVILAGARGHFYAVIITSDGIHGGVPLKLDVTDEQLRADYEHVNNTHRLHRGALLSEVITGNKRAMRVLGKIAPLDRWLQLLWLKVVKPVLEVLKLQPLSSPNCRPRLHWCLTGAFTSAPLHGAGIYEGSKSQRQCCADYVISSYTPNLTTLLRTKRALTPLARKDLALTMIAEEQAQGGLPRIPGVNSELREIGSIATLNSVKVVGALAGSTTIAGTCEAVRRANVVHLACHGVQDGEDATTSGFCLGDGRLTISKLVKLDIRQGFLAFLSACETAKGSDEQPDQAMHLAAAMLFMGFKSVIATMWAISDDDGPEVAKWFYEELFAQDVIDGNAVAYALDNAMGKLRNSGAPSHQWVPFIHMGA